MYLVVSHEQLDATFEQHTEDGRMMKVRNDLLSGKWGRVKRIDRQLVELLESKDDVHTYVDLVNMNFFKGTKDDKPRVVKLGGFEFIRNGNKIGFISPFRRDEAYLVFSAIIRASLS